MQIPYTTAEEWYTEICPYTTAGQCNMVSNTMWYLEEIRAENGIKIQIPQAEQVVFLLIDKFKWTIFEIFSDVIHGVLSLLLCNKKLYLENYKLNYFSICVFEL